jgi:hypothetical protein
MRHETNCRQSIYIILCVSLKVVAMASSEPVAAMPLAISVLMPWKLRAGTLHIVWQRCVALAALRLINALLLCTYTTPDEYWQGPEVAHRLVFGYGYL